LEGTQKEAVGGSLKVIFCYLLGDWGKPRNTSVRLFYVSVKV